MDDEPIPTVDFRKHAVEILLEVFLGLIRFGHGRIIGANDGSKAVLCELAAQGHQSQVDPTG